MRQRRMQAVVRGARRMHQGDGGEKERTETWEGDEGSYRRQKRRRAQPAIMPEGAGPPKPKADFPATTLHWELCSVEQKQQLLSIRAAAYIDFPTINRCFLPRPFE
jgi:hypothetical protein